MMKNRNGILRLTVVTILSFGIILYSGYDFLSGLSADKSYSLSKLPSSAIPMNGGFTTPLEVPQNTEPSADNSSQSSDIGTNSEAVSAGATGNVLGAVKEKFISPYTANTSFSGVYLKNSTNLDIDIKALLSSPLEFSIEKNGQPQVLIMHTHTTESFLRESRDYYTDADAARTTDNNYNMVRLGKIIADKLNSAGITTLHDTTAHDYPAYSGSYTRSAATVKSYLKKYPSIKIVIDLHRDAISAGGNDKAKPIAEINGKKAAQVMLVMGSQSGSVTGHEKWQENLKLAVRLQQKLETLYPTLARSLSLVSKNYNQNLSTGSMLIEVGTEANSIDEVCYSAELLSNALIGVLQ